MVNQFILLNTTQLVYKNKKFLTSASPIIHYNHLIYCHLLNYPHHFNKIILKKYSTLYCIVLFFVLYLQRIK